jgi:pantoate--beta-alanine ligase
MPVEVVGEPTVRDPDGLAKSSRNAYLSPTERGRALAISQCLAAARERFLAGERDVGALVAVALAILKDRVDRVDYLEIRDADSLRPVERLDRPAVMLIAVFVGATRLIDNRLAAYHWQSQNETAKQSKRKTQTEARFDESSPTS